MSAEEVLSPSLTDLANADKAEREAQKGGTAETDPPGQDKGEALTAAKEGPAGTAITQIFEKRLTAPDEAARKTLPKLFGNLPILHVQKVG